MKKVAIVCAAGKQGTCLVNEAVARGYDVTGFVRGNATVANPKAKTVRKDLFGAEKRENEVVIRVRSANAFRPPEHTVCSAAEEEGGRGLYLVDALTVSRTYSEKDGVCVIVRILS